MKRLTGPRSSCASASAADREDDHAALNAGPLLVQRASEGALGGLRRLVRDLRLDAHLHGDLILTGRDPVIRSPHRLGKATATAQLLHLPRTKRTGQT
jgi:hypothetical protein